MHPPGTDVRLGPTQPAALATPMPQMPHRHQIVAQRVTAVAAAHRVGGMRQVGAPDARIVDAEQHHVQRVGADAFLRRPPERLRRRRAGRVRAQGFGRILGPGRLGHGLAGPQGAEVGQRRVVGVEQHDRGRAQGAGKIAPALGDCLQLAVAVELVPEQVHEHHGPGLQYPGDLTESALVHLEDADAPAARRLLTRATAPEPGSGAPGGSGGPAVPDAPAGSGVRAGGGAPVGCDPHGTADAAAAPPAAAPLGPPPALSRQQRRRDPARQVGARGVGRHVPAVGAQAGAQQSGRGGLAVGRRDVDRAAAEPAAQPAERTRVQPVEHHARQAGAAAPPGGAGEGAGRGGDELGKATHAPHRTDDPTPAPGSAPPPGSRRRARLAGNPAASRRPRVPLRRQTGLRPAARGFRSVGNPACVSRLIRLGSDGRAGLRPVDGAALL